MTRYASETRVTTDASRAEIEKTLKRYGATAFYYAQDGERVMVGFRFDIRMIKFVLVMPDPEAKEFTHHSQGRRAVEAQNRLYEQACRQRWRALALIIKAKLEAVAAGITTVEDEFLAHTVLPSGATVAEWMKPQLAVAYERGEMPSTLMLEGPK